MGIIRIILEEPEKIQAVIINLIKLVITVLITHVIFSFPELKSLGSIEKLKDNLPLGQTLIFILAIVFIWFFVWTIGYTLFLASISYWRKSNNEFNSQSLNRDYIKEILMKVRVFTITERGYILPSRHIARLTEIGETLTTNQRLSFSNTILAQWVFVLTVICICLIIKMDMSFSKVIWIAVFVCVIIFVYYILRLVDRVFEAFQEYSMEVNDFLQTLLFRKIVTTILVNNFKGKLNDEHTGYTINLGNQEFNVQDVAFFNNEIGNIKLFKELKVKHKNLENKLIIVSNIEPDLKLSNLIRSLNIKAYIHATNEEELLVGLYKLESFLDKQYYKENT